MKILETLRKYVLLATLFLVPLSFATLFSNFFDLPKTTLLVFGVAIGLVLFLLGVLVSGKLSLATSNFDIPLLVLAVAYLLSAIIRTPSKMDAFLFPGSATIVLGALLFYFLLNMTFSGTGKKIISQVLFLSATLASALSLIAVSGIFSKIPSLPAFMKDGGFSVLGGTLPQAIFIAVVLPLGVALLLTERESVKKLFWGVSLALTSLALVVSVYLMLPGKPTAPALPDMNTSWVVAVESLKQSPFLGMGAGNYLTAFNRYRPLSYNATNLWAVRFTTANSFLFTLMTEVGLLGLAALVLLLIKSITHLRNELPKITSGYNMENAAAVSLVLSLIFLLLLPANIALVVTLFVVLAINSKSNDVFFPLTASGSGVTSKAPAAFVTLPLIAALVAFSFYAGRALMAEAKYKAALDALSQNNGKLTYDTLRAAIGLNPYVDRYRASYSVVNMALARAIAQKTDLTDADRNTISQLIQQAIREGKSVVALNPARAGAWETLARTYQAIIPFAQGADNFTIQSFGQAAALDPVNPNLKITLGGVYYALGRYDDAVRVFELAVISKPDLANGHYNLAIAYREQGEIEKALAQMKLVEQLVNKDSPDYQTVLDEIKNLESRRPSAESTGTDNLTPPQPAEEPVIKPPLSLPEGANPPTSGE